jgi:N4-gp56 family major capsid protein
MTVLSTDATLSSEMKTYYDRRLIARALPTLLFSKFAQRRSIPKHGGKTIEFRKFASLGVSKTALTEGTPPSGQSLTVTAITATVDQYGDGVKFSDIVRTTTIDPILEETTDLLAEQAAESIDELVRDVLVAGTSVQYWDGSRANRLAITDTDTLNVDAIRRAVLTLQLNRARKINGMYHAIIHPRQAHDLQGEAEWVDAQLGGERTGRVQDGSLGSLYGVKFWVTDKVSVVDNGTTSNADVYLALFFGADAYGIVALEGHNLQTIFHPLGSAGTADMLNQQSSMGWKVAFTTKIISDEFMVRVETATSTGDNA